MNKHNNMEATSETSRLLTELDQAIDQSSVMREIIRKYEYIRSIENITGPSRLTRIMRKEIELMESKLSALRTRRAKQDAVFSPG
jgi:predicted nucleotide-binding protein (sugar kinase/HSP70/actin superfamily)